VGASGATQREAWVHPMDLLAVASAIMQVWLVSLLVGCELGNVANGLNLASKVAGKVACRVQIILHAVVLAWQQTALFAMCHGVTSQDQMAHEHLGPRPPEDHGDCGGDAHAPLPCRPSPSLHV